MKNYSFILLFFTIFLCVQGAQAAKKPPYYLAYDNFRKNFNLNKKIPRARLLSRPDELEKPDPGEIAPRLNYIHKHKLGEYVEELNFFDLRRKPGELTPKVRKEIIKGKVKLIVDITNKEKKVIPR